MTVKKTNKKQSIIETFMNCVIEQGLNNSSMAEIASKVGIDRSSLYYYFKSREELIDALVQFVVDQYIDQFSRSLSAYTNHQHRAEQLVEHLFGGRFHQPGLSQVIDELAVLANREKHINAQVKSIYQAVELAILREVDQAFPDADPEKRRWAAYALNQLAEGCSVFTSYGFSSDRLEAGRLAAQCILKSVTSS
ncbi:TetR/AcrR family transcriptional regulator [Pantoea sp. Ap-967]|uniref:TetR/AcrR family transcriptional regulator n=1 Tax=Pantoea sp. Ap-967 TaxID=2608362 RepID=UPI00142245CC|nr:TetR/AcrR family transcriptional regulator [Pantoea sp. Ap-967]NIE72947.1 TetR/AcrR family transcriptional regulator [Pantoea sp. Ap-967]